MKLLNYRVVCMLAIFILFTGVVFSGGQTESTVSMDKMIKLDAPVRITTTTTTGDPLDLRTRVMAKYLEKFLGQSVTVENKPGAGGRVALTSFVKEAGGPYDIIAAPDSPFTVVPLFGDVPFSIQDLKPIMAIDKQLTGLFVNPKKTGINTFEDLIAFGRKNAIRFGSGAGNITWLLQAALYKELGFVQPRNVVHNGANEGLINVLGGHVDVTYSGLTLGRGFVEDNMLKAIVTFDDQSYQGYKGVDAVPSLTELGYDYVSGDLIFFSAHKDINPIAYDILVDAFNKCLQDEECVAELRKIGVETILAWDGERTNKYINDTHEFLKGLYESISK